jgi:hypothetical protein
MKGNLAILFGIFLIDSPPAVEFTKKKRRWDGKFSAAKPNMSSKILFSSFIYSLIHCVTLVSKYCTRSIAK